MTSDTSSVFWVSPAEPWSPWTLSGITLSMCQELRDRGLLHGAMNARIPKRSGLDRPPVLPIRIRNLIGRVRPATVVPWEREGEGLTGQIIRELPDNVTAVYQFVCPDADPSLDVRRFRYMDLSLMDAVRTRTYGHDNMTTAEIDKKFDQQKRLLDVSQGVITLSTHAADAIAADFDYPRERITPIGAGAGVRPSGQVRCDHDRYAAARILFLGFNWQRKGGDLLVDAFRIVRERIPHAKLHVVGPAECPSDEAGVEWTPPIDKTTKRGREQLERCFASASVFCMPSVCETWGLVYVEAQQRGTPVVGLREWAVPDIVEEGRTGFFAAERSAESLADALIEALENPERLAEMGVAAQQRVADVFGWPQVVDRSLHGIEPKLLGDRKPVWMQSIADTQMVESS